VNGEEDEMKLLTEEVRAQMASDVSNAYFFLFSLRSSKE